MRLRHIFDKRSLVACLALAPIVLFAACGGGDEPAMEAESMSEPAAEPASSGPPRVFFVRPLEGEAFQVEFPVAFEFGIENYELSPVPENVEQPRMMMGHHHLGVDTECLPAGEVIQQGDPWIHFGDGSTTIEMQLEPGPHTFVLQLGDDEHRTQEGLCATVSIEVAEGI